MAPLVLYHSEFSPFSRSVLLLIRYLDIEVDVKTLDLLNKEQFSEEFLQINPQHCVPTIDDNGFYLWESRAILSYLFESRAPQLLPTFPKEKAIVNQRLHFELGGLTKKFVEIISPIFAGTSTSFDESKMKELHEILFTIDEHYFLSGNEWIAGEIISAADFSYAASISTLVEVGVSLEKYPRLHAWLERCKSSFPHYAEANEKGAKMLGGYLLSKMS